MSIDWAARILSHAPNYGAYVADVYGQYLAAATPAELAERLRLSPLSDEIRVSLCAAKQIEVREHWEAARVPVTNVEATMPFAYYRRLTRPRQRVLCAYLEMGCDSKLLDEIIQIYGSADITAEKFLADGDIQEIVAAYNSQKSSEQS